MNSVREHAWFLPSISGNIPGVYPPRSAIILLLRSVSHPRLQLSARPVVLALALSMAETSTTLLVSAPAGIQS